MRRFLSLLIVFTLLVGACGGDGDEAEAPATTAAAASETTDAQQDETSTTAAPATTTTAAATTTTTTTTTAAPDVLDSPLLAALAQSNEVTSGRMEGSMVIIGPEGTPAGTEIAIEFSGAFDNATGDSSMIMDMSGLVDAAPDDEIPPGFEDLFGEMEIRTIGDTAYMRFGFFAMLGVETEWVSMTAEDAGTAAGSFGANPANPAEMMSAFANGDVEIIELGTEQVRGMNTTHFRIIVDVEAMMAAADEEALEELESLTLPGDGTMPVEFWLGDDGNIYRLLMDFVGTDVADSGFESMQMLWEMFDFGADIEIEAPPEDQVTDGDDLTAFLTG